MRRMLLVVLVVILVFAMNKGDIWAQATAQISGTAKDQSGAVLPGVEIHVSQIETGITRDAISNETGSYVLTNLPIGPYRLEASLPGFRTYAQTGIVLQVNSSPAVNVVLEVGQVAETIEVQANAALVETRNAGIGAVVENARILELPLNGRSMIELVALAGAATPAPLLDGSGGRDPFSKGNVSVAGGLQTGLNYTLDGAYHNNPQDSSYMSLPFPDALQEFKVETGATGAQNGVKSSGSVSLVTKSGTNGFHGDLFEFVRNYKFNARNAFATRRDSIKRNQFGGTLGGPITRNKVFFFGAYQGTRFREDPSADARFVPTPAILAGDFTAFASPACNAGRQITLRAPFVNNRIDPSLFSKPAVILASKLPKSSDPCGKIVVGMPKPENDHMALGKIDYQWNANHSIFGRYLFDSIKVEAPYNITRNLVAGNGPGTGSRGRAQAFTVGDTYLFGANIVNALRLTANRIYGAKVAADYASAGAGPADIGVKAFSYLPHIPDQTVTGAFTTRPQNPGGGKTVSNIFAASDDFSVLRGNHQLALGTQIAMWWVDNYSDSNARMAMTFNGQTTGLGMGDFFLGYVSQMNIGTDTEQHKRNMYYGLYSADTWKVNQKLTMSYGLRWEPYFPITHRDNSAMHFDVDAFRQGIKSKRFDNLPAGLLFAGDPGFPGAAGMYTKWWNFSPRVGLAWDPAGDGRTSVRASVGTFFDFPPTVYMLSLANGAPYSPRLNRTNVSFEDPWANEPGGDPFPTPHGPYVRRDVPWALYTSISTLEYDTPNTRVGQWNLSVQRQIATNWLMSVSYLGNGTRHLFGTQPINPAVYIPGGTCTLNGITYNPCSSTSSTDRRRRLSFCNAQAGQYYGSVQKLDAGGTASYNGMILSVQRRAARGVTINGNYTWSHCISDPGGDTAFSGTSGNNGFTNPDSRRFDRGNCTGSGTDRRHLLNLSAVAETPMFSNATLRVMGSGWRFAPIFRVLSGSYMSVTTNQDRALNGVANQRVNQLIVNPYGDKSVSSYLNPAAFALPAVGTYGNAGAGSIVGPGTWQFDLALSRSFQFSEAQKLELRVEAFNVTNSLRMENPTTNLNDNTFGQVTTAKDPRIMQFAVKYFF